ncbi:19570_t:CDS:2, partial [Racocetra persica]
IPRSTIYDNIKRLKVRGNVDHARGNAAYLSSIGNDVSYRTIGRYLAIIGYVKNVPRKTSMLTNDQKRKRVEWAQAHLNDNWNRTFFTDESAFQLFRNTLKHWHKKVNGQFIQFLKTILKLNLDLNAIKNLWCIVKNNVEKCMPYNLQELERYMKEEWNKIPNSVLVSLVGSMRRRCELVIENNGERISF